jgi:hypothetical protein
VAFIFLKVSSASNKNIDIKHQKNYRCAKIVLGATIILVATAIGKNLPSTTGLGRHAPYRIVGSRMDVPGEQR